MTPYEHPDWPAFVRAIRAQDDNVTKLVAADWLEEHGEPDRAAVVRGMVSGKSLASFRPSFKQVRHWFTFGKCEPNPANVTADQLRYYQTDRAGFGPFDAIGICWGGFITGMTAGACFVLDNFDRAISVHPVATVMIPPDGWAHEGPDGFPIIRAGVRFEEGIQGYHVGGKSVLIDEREVEGRLEACSRERAVAELAFEVRYPGVKFNIHI